MLIIFLFYLQESAKRVKKKKKTQKHDFNQSFNFNDQVCFIKYIISLDLDDKNTLFKFICAETVFD